MTARAALTLPKAIKRAVAFAVGRGSAARILRGIQPVNPAWWLGCMRGPAAPAHKTRTWPASIEALRRRGALAIWFDPARPQGSSKACCA
jgi:hypothetical protein